MLYDSSMTLFYSLSERVIKYVSVFEYLKKEITDYRRKSKCGTDINSYVTRQNLKKPGINRIQLHAITLIVALTMSGTTIIL